MTPPEEVRTEVYRRFSDSLYPLVYGTIAVFFAVGARSNRQERLWSLLVVIALALAVRGLGFFLISVSGTAPAWALLNFAVPVASILFFFTLIAMNKSLRFSAAWIDWSNALGNALMNRFGGLRPRDAAQPTGGAGRRRPHPFLLSLPALRGDLPAVLPGRLHHRLSR